MNKRKMNIVASIKHEPEDLVIDGMYEVSTIDYFGDGRRFQTVLFKETGVGMEQIELWIDAPSPTNEQVVDALNNKKFYTYE